MSSDVRDFRFMDAMPQTQYARLGEEYIAYQVFGEGPDIIFVRSAWNHVSQPSEWYHHSRWTPATLRRK